MKDTMDKVFHVSPFIGMDNHYDWRVTEPNGRLLVHIDEHDPDGNQVFDATLSLERVPAHPLAHEPGAGALPGGVTESRLPHLLERGEAQAQGRALLPASGEGRE